MTAVQKEDRRADEKIWDTTKRLGNKTKKKKEEKQKLYIFNIYIYIQKKRIIRIYIWFCEFCAIYLGEY